MTLALFDMDDTLVRTNTAGLFFKSQWRARALDHRQMLRIAWVLVRYRLDVVDMAMLIEHAAAHIQGHPEAEMQDLCRRLYEREVRPAICPEARRALEQHQARGDVCAIVTASTPYIARLLAEDLGVPHVLCTELEVEGGRFTGRLIGEPCFGRAKVRRADELAREHGKDLREAYFYTDSHSDAPLLAAVGHPRVVRPDPRLRLTAWRKGWPVLRW
jgi:HAD superfamily hydrolase (TIGR01490 family)